MAVQTQSHSMRGFLRFFSSSQEYSTRSSRADHENQMSDHPFQLQIIQEVALAFVDSRKRE